MNTTLCSLTLLHCSGQCACYSSEEESAWCFFLCVATSSLVYITGTWMGRGCVGLCAYVVQHITFEWLITGSIILYTPNQPAALTVLNTGGRGGNSTLFTGNQWSPPQSSQTKDGRATDSCFALVGAHQCGVLMDVLGWLTDCVSTASARLVVSSKTAKEAIVYTVLVQQAGLG